MHFNMRTLGLVTILFEITMSSSITEKDHICSQSLLLSLVSFKRLPLGHEDCKLISLNRVVWLGIHYKSQQNFVFVVLDFFNRFCMILWTTGVQYLQLFFLAKRNLNLVSFCTSILECLVWWPCLSWYHLNIV